MKLLGDGTQPAPALFGVGRNQSDRAGDVGPQIGDGLRRDRAVGNLERPACRRGHPRRDIRRLEYQKNIHLQPP